MKWTLAKAKRRVRQVFQHLEEMRLAETLPTEWHDELADQLRRRNAIPDLTPSCFCQNCGRDLAENEKTKIESSQSYTE